MKSKSLAIGIIGIAFVLLSAGGIAYYYYATEDVTPEESEAAECCGAVWIDPCSDGNYPGIGNDPNFCASQAARNYPGAYQYAYGIAQTGGTCSKNCANVEDPRYEDWLQECADDSDTVGANCGEYPYKCCDLERVDCTPLCENIFYYEKDSSNLEVAPFDENKEYTAEAIFKAHKAVAESVRDTQYVIPSEFFFIIEGSEQRATKVEVNGSEYDQPLSQGGTKGTGVGTIDENTEFMAYINFIPSEYGAQDQFTLIAYALDETGDRVESAACNQVQPLLQNPTCGNESCDIDEECDTGFSCDPETGEQTGTVETGVCRQDCTYCGDGIRNGSEECDGGGDSSSTCTAECRIPQDVPPSCGNESCDIDETCDTGYSCDPESGDSTGTLDDNVCREDCTYCGDQIVNGDEECDEGEETLTCTAECTNPGSSNFDVEKAGTKCVERMEPYNIADFQITITNNRTVSEDISKVVDKLPLGFEYLTGTTKINGLSASDPEIQTVGNSQQLTWTTPLGWSVAANGQMTVSYSTKAGANAITGNNQNEVTITPVDNPEASSDLTTEFVLTVAQSCTAPKTGLLDNTVGKVTLGVLALLLAFGFYYMNAGEEVLNKLGNLTVSSGTKIGNSLKLFGLKLTDRKEFFEANVEDKSTKIGEGLERKKSVKK